MLFNIYLHFKITCRVVLFACLYANLSNNKGRYYPSTSSLLISAVDTVMITAGKESMLQLDGGWASLLQWSQLPRTRQAF